MREWGEKFGSFGVRAASGIPRDAAFTKTKKAVVSGSCRTPAFLACDVTRATPLPRPLVRRAPVHPLAGSFPWSRAILLLQGHRHLAKHPRHCSPPKKRVALTAVREREAVTVRGVRIRGPWRCREERFLRESRYKKGD